MFKCKKSTYSFFCKMERKKQRRDEELLQKIILRVKELRHMHNHQSQEQLAEATELGIAQLESGKNFPNLTTIRLLQVYNITLDEFSPRSITRRKKNKPLGGLRRRLSPGQTR